MFVTRPSHQPTLRIFDDIALLQLCIGLHVVGDDGFNPLPTHALARRGLSNNIVGYPLMQHASVESPGGAIIQSVLSSQTDVAVVWGPFGSYFGKLQRPQLNVRPVEGSSGSRS